MAKFYDKRTLNHEQAVAWVGQQVIGMGFAYNALKLEAGVDAVIELADPGTGEAQAGFLGVQVKTAEEFDAESAERFSFYAEGKDIAYWDQSTIPVLLVLCRARTEEAYAVWVRDYFRTPENVNSKTVAFFKSRDRFNGGEIWKRKLLQGGMPYSRGFSLPPVPEAEELSSNLLEVVLPKTLFYGRTAMTTRQEVFAELKRRHFSGGEFILRGDLVYSLHSLYDTAWSGIVENLSIKPMDFAELAFHTDEGKRRYAVELLNICLNARLRQDEVYWSEQEEMFIYFPKRMVTQRIRKPVRTDSGETKRGLIFPTLYKGRVVRCRHLAMMANFVEIGSTYYLQVDPTYYFSRDGRRKHPRWEDLIRSARILQKERDYHSNLEVWRELLTQEADLTRPEYGFLRFKDYRRFVAPVSIPDNVWKPASQALTDGNLDQHLMEFVR